MNLVGKIFTVLIFVMSLFFMAFAVAVYSTHKNWREVVMNPKDQATRDKPVGLMYQLEDLRTRKQELEDQKLKLEGELEAERKAAIQVRSKLETANERLQDEVEKQRKENVRLDEAQRKAVAALETSHKELARLRGEVDQLRADILDAQQKRDKHFKMVVQLTDELHQAANELKRLKGRQLTLAADLAKANEVLRKFKLVPEPALYEGVPPDVEGLVMAVPEPDLIEVTIGADDGLLEGHKLFVYRPSGNGNKYVGRFQVVRTEPDRCVCKADPGYRQSYPERGDRVTSKIR